MLTLLKKFKPYWKQITGVLVFTFLNALSQLYLPKLMANIVDGGIIQGDTSYILSTGVYMILVALLSTISMIISAYLSSRSAMGFGRDIRETVFTKVEGFSLNEFDKVGTASLITRTTNDIAQVQQVGMMSLRLMVRAPMMLIGGIIMALSTNKSLARIFLVSGPVLLIVIFIIARKGFPFFKIIQEKTDGLNLVLREKLTGIRVIRAFDRVDYERERFDHANKDLTDTNLKVTRLMSAMNPLLSIVMNFTIVGVIWFGSKAIDMGNMQIGDLMAFIQYVTSIMFSLVMLSMMFIMIPRAAVSANRINEVLDMESEIKDKDSTIKPKENIGTLEFKDVSFAYHGAENPALCNISFKAEQGETIAIIGGTGSGKSTLINLIPRFYDINKGQILIDGIDIRDMEQEILRSKIGFVPQQAVLFTGSIKENVRYGKEDATDEEVSYALNISQATDFVSNMDEGFDSYIAQGGTNVSGGQKQRLSIARALVREPEIYIFDDSFSALDFKTDANLRKALKPKTANSITLIVAQRVTTVMDADKIIVLDEGRIAGMGKHTELLKTSDVYKEIVKSQLSEEEIA